MKVTAENISTLENGQELFFVESASMVDRYTFMGQVKGFGKDMDYLLVGHNKLKRISVKHAETNEILRYGDKLFTTYAESCEQVRIHLINKIDHHNKHELKGMEIAISEEDQKHLWFNK